MARSDGDFALLVHPIVKFLNETPDRVPMTDWYDTITGRMTAFRARSVVGGVYIKMLADPVMWQRWVKKASAVP